MNFVPARLTWLVIVIVAAVLPHYSGRKAWTIGLNQHALLLGPNSGWSEAATAGALQRRVVGPIWLEGVQVTDLWIGDSRDPELSTSADATRAVALIVITGIVVAAVAVALAQFFDFSRPPGLLEPRLERSVQTQDREPALARDCLVQFASLPAGGFGLPRTAQLKYRRRMSTTEDVL